MSLSKKIIVVLCIVLSPILVYSGQLEDSIKTKIDLKSLKEEHRLMISTKMGYHTGYETKKNNGFNDGLIFGFNTDVGLMETFFIGFNFEFWHHNSGELKSYFGKYTTTYSAYCFSVNFIKRFINEDYSINFGIGLGKYIFKETYGNNEDYFAPKLLTGFDIKIYKLLWISAEGNYNLMFNMDKGATFFSFKIGPTLTLPILLP